MSGFPLRPLYVCLCLAALPLGFACGDDSAGQPAGPDVTPGQPAPGQDGASCTRADDCFSGTCLTELESGLPSGYCTAFECTSGGVCNGGVCVEADGSSACLDPCNDVSDCRDGYSCLEFGDRNLCDFDGEPGNEVGESPGGECLSGCNPGAPLRIDCGYTPSRELQARVNQWGLPYDLAVGVDGFALIAFADGDVDDINIVSLRNSNDELMALKGADSALNVTSFMENELAAVTIPHGPRYESILEGPSGLLQVQSTADEMCLALAQGLEGTQLDLRVYLIGTEAGMRIDTIGFDPDFQEMLAELDRLLGLAGITVDELTALEVSESDRQAYRIIRSDDDFNAVLELTTDPSTEPDAQPVDAMVVNLMLIDDLALSTGVEAIGQAGLLPGPPGIHGTRYSGLVAETASFRDAPTYLALIIAHELGHFLGLRHTSETFQDDVAFGRHDPLDDTRECPDVIALGSGCPDYENLMFPLAPVERDAEDIELSVDQGWVLRRNPLVR